MQEGFVLKGQVELEIIREDGSIEIIKNNNTIMDVSRQNVANILLGNDTSGVIPMFFGVGTDPTISNVNMSELVVPLGARKFLVSKDKSYSSLVYQFQSAAGEHTGTWKEAGLFSSYNDTGTLFCRANISPVNKAAGDTINGTWRIIF